MKQIIAHFPIILCLSLLMGVSKCDNPDFERTGTPPINFALEDQRRQSAADFPEPHVDKILRDGSLIWKMGDAAPTIYAGETLELDGSGLGSGTIIDYSKILIGRARVIESDLQMYVGNVNVKKALFFEVNESLDTWKSGILNWAKNRILFKVPETTDRGPLVVSVQKRVGSNPSLTVADRLHSVWDPNSERVHGPFSHKSDVVSQLSEAKLSNSIDVVVVNKTFKERVAEGEKIFWSYDFNIGAVHNARGQDWTAILQGKTTDPMTGKKADPEKLFGAIPITSSIDVPKIAREKVAFDPYPIPNPLTTISGNQLYSGETNPTGYVGYIYASSLAPKTGIKGNWVGFSCVACHGMQISFPNKDGRTISKVFPGLPNPNWNMKWAILSKFQGIKGKEVGVSGDVDKSMMLYHAPNGAGEHTIVRSSLDDFAPLRNDFLYSPIAFPNVTTHTPLRRSLSRTEFYAGFEGSYIHSEEPDGAIGAMYAEPLKSLTAYMTTLNKDDQLLHNLGMYRWLKEKGLLSEVENTSEKEFIYSDKKDYPILASRLGRGEEIYKNNCLSCHAKNFGTGSDENMMPLNKVGTYYSPTVFQRETQSVRTAMMTHLYWVQKRGLLHDTHVKSLEDLVDPARCDSTSDLYKKYYTMNAGTFKIPVGTEDQAKFTGAHAYFSRVSWDKNNFYWDYQKMLKEFGPREFGSSGHISLPSTPHPWCIKEKTEVADLVSYLLTL